jgi:hypothetical protein
LWRTMGYRLAGRAPMGLIEARAIVASVTPVQACLAHGVYVHLRRIMKLQIGGKC